jgi:hypothetical protein
MDTEEKTDLILFNGSLTSIHVSSLDAHGLAFYRIPSNTPGAKLTEEDGINFVYNKVPESCILFTNLKSLDVVIGWLQDVRKKFLPKPEGEETIITGSFDMKVEVKTALASVPEKDVNKQEMEINQNEKS